MSYQFELRNKSVVITHWEVSAPIVVESWTWQAAALTQLIYERETLRVRVAELELALAAKQPDAA